MKRLMPSIAAVVAGAVIPFAARAHPGHAPEGLADGLIHPLSGADHLVAMVLVGFVSTSALRRAGRSAAAVFILALGLGFATSAMAVTTFGAANLVEALVMLSLLALGAAAVLRIELPAVPTFFALAIFGYAHGAAHGIDVPQGSAPWLFAAGFLTTSVLLLAAGSWLARNLAPLPQRRDRLALAARP